MAGPYANTDENNVTDIPDSPIYEEKKTSHKYRNRDEKPD
jgi:hypothetical protein